MNSLYTLGVRQTSSVQADLDRLRNAPPGEATAPLLGQIAASLAGMARTIEDYDALARREMITAKQEKAAARVAKFRTDYNELRREFERMKGEQADTQRAALLSTSSGAAASTSGAPDFTRRRAPMSAAPPADDADNPFRPNPSRGYGDSSYGGGGLGAREAHALREHGFAAETHARLDDMLAQGRAALDDLVDQRALLTGTQRRLRGAAETLGLSRDVISWIDRRSTQDVYIFWAGAVFTFFCFFMIWKYLG